MPKKYFDKLSQLREKVWYRMLKVIYVFFIVLIVSFAIGAIMDEFLFHEKLVEGLFYSLIPLFIAFIFNEVVRRTFYYIFIGSSNPENINLLTSLKRINYKKSLILFFLVIIIFGGYYYFPIIKTKISPRINKNINQLIQEETPFDIIDTKETIEQWMPKAEKGEAYAQFKVGYAYYKDENYEEAKKWLDKSVNQNESDAQFALSIMYLGGYGVEKDLEKRIELLRKSAEQNNPHALFSLWHEYNERNSLLDEITKEEKENILEKALKGLSEESLKGGSRAKEKLAFAYKEGIGVNKNLNKAIQLWEESEGSSAYNALGFIYLKGEGEINKDLNKSFEYFNKSALKGNTSSQLQVSQFYLTGDIVVQDYNKAIEWLQKAAEKENETALWILGLFYLEGCPSVEKNEKKAFEYLEKAANKNSYQAQYLLSIMYFEGRGILKSYTKGLEWLKKASENNEPKALLKLADMYFSGKYIEKDLNKAKELWEKAGKYGNAEIKFTISNRIDDDIKSYMWRLLSAAEGNKEAKESLENMEYWMSKEDIIKAQELAAEYQKENSN